jgi:hypothetical protein
MCAGRAIRHKLRAIHDDSAAAAEACGGKSDCGDDDGYRHCFTLRSSNGPELPMLLLYRTV